MLRKSIKALLVISALLAIAAAAPEGEKPRAKSAATELPKPIKKGVVSIEEALWSRRSVRFFSGDALTEAQLSQLFWSAQGISDAEHKLRTAPSAGATYPLELYAVTAEGVHKYDCLKHSIELVKAGDQRAALGDAAMGQQSVRQAPVSFVITGVYARTARKYGERAERYVHIEVGCAGENLMLQAAAMGLGSVAVGAYDDAKVANVIDCPKDEIPLLVIPVGKAG